MKPYTDQKTRIGKRVRRSNNLIFVWIMLPAAVFISIALFLDAHERREARHGLLSERSLTVAQLVGERMELTLELADFCAGSGHLQQRLDFEHFVEDCGRLAGKWDMWVVVVLLDETHTKILDTRPSAGNLAKGYPRSAEFPELLALEEKSRQSGNAELANVIKAIDDQRGLVVAGKLSNLPDGNEVMVYAGFDAHQLSDRLKSMLSDMSDGALAVVDGTRRVVARSSGIEQHMFLDAPTWLVSLMETGQSGIQEGQHGPLGDKYTWDVGFRPLATAPGWTVVSLLPRKTSLPVFDGIPLSSYAVILGLFATVLTAWLLKTRERVLIRLEKAERNRFAAEMQNRSKSRLLASLAHEVRNPLVRLIGALEIGSDSRSDTLTTAQANITAKQTAISLMQLLDDILELSFLGSGEMKLVPTPVDLEEMAREVVDQFLLDARNKELDLRLTLDSNLPGAVMTDRLRLLQVLSNLVSNGIKYTSSGGVEIAISKLAGTDRKVTLSFAVTDSGKGIAEDDVSKVVKEFGRLENSGTAGEKSTGLGLAICNRILRTMGSELKIESTLGKGSAFSFTLDLDLAGKVDTSEEQDSLAGLCILYGEDEPIIRELTTHRLEAAGATVVSACDGRDILDKLPTMTPDVILVDLEMPRIDGVETVRRIRTDHKAWNCPIFVLTAHAAGAKTTAARHAGADEVFTKPVQIRALAIALAARRGATGKNAPRMSRARPLSPASSPDVEEAAFRELVANGREDMETLVIAQFEVNIRTALLELEESIAEHDLKTAADIAHQEAGLCKVLHATRLAQRLDDLQDDLSTARLDRVARIMTKLPDLIDSAVAEMKRLVALAA